MLGHQASQSLGQPGLA